MMYSGVVCVVVCCVILQCIMFVLYAIYHVIFCCITCCVIVFDALRSYVPPCAIMLCWLHWRVILTVVSHYYVCSCVVLYLVMMFYDTHYYAGVWCCTSLLYVHCYAGLYRGTVRCVELRLVYLPCVICYIICYAILCCVILLGSMPRRLNAFVRALLHAISRYCLIIWYALYRHVFCYIVICGVMLWYVLRVVCRPLSVYIAVFTVVTRHYIANCSMS